VDLHTKVVVITTTTNPATPNLAEHNAEIETACKGWTVNSVHTLQKLGVVTVHTSSMPLEKDVLVITTTLLLTREPSLLD
jgi:hypothetical protein